MFDKEAIKKELLDLVSLPEEDKEALSKSIDIQLIKIEENNLQDFFIGLMPKLKAQFKRNSSNIKALQGQINGFLTKQMAQEIEKQRKRQVVKENLKKALLLKLYEFINQAKANYNTTTLDSDKTSYTNGTITNNVSISTEYSLKVLYTILNIDNIVEEYIDNPKDLDELLSEVWKKIKDNFTNSTPITTAKDLDEKYAKEYSKNRWSSHSHYPVLHSLSDRTTTMIKYQIMTANCRPKENDRIPINPLVPFTAIDYLLMTKTFDAAESEIKANNLDTVTTSNYFDINRYLIGSITDDNLERTLNISYACLLVAEYEFENLKSTLLTNTITIPTELQLLLNQYNITTLSNRELEILTTKFTINEVKWMFESYQLSNTGNINDFIYYCIFFKNYINNKDFSYNIDKYKNIISLFEIIRNTNELDKVSTIITNWLNNIDISSLSDEEIRELDSIDHAFIHNSLSFSDRIMYERCKQENIPFSLKYSEFHLNNSSELTALYYLRHCKLIKPSINKIGNNDFNSVIELFEKEYGIKPADIPSYVFDYNLTVIKNITDFYISLGLTYLKRIPSYYPHNPNERFRKLIEIYKKYNKDIYDIPLSIIENLDKLDLTFLDATGFVYNNIDIFKYTFQMKKQDDQS